MKKYIWKLNKKNLSEANLTLYTKFIEKKYNVNFENNFNKLWEWSINNTEDFWKSIWDFTKI